MRWTHWILVVLHIVLWTTVAVLSVSYISKTHEMSFLKILGSIEKDLSLPVFAQFVVTQTLVVHDPFRGTEMIIPMYLPEHSLPITITLLQDNSIISRWKYPDSSSAQEGYQTAHLRFLTPVLLQGKYEVRFDGGSIMYEDNGRAPRLFTETFDGAYPDGNYRIANNEKEGDIALELRGEKTNGEIALKRIHHDPVGRTSFFLLIASLAVFLVYVPTALLQLLQTLRVLFRL